ncbi:MAG: hypothetical protein HYZ26_07255 [Chloroflexi bacterium]|nr:hypothetical protein [Chloroflexota bacterium]
MTLEYDDKGKIFTEVISKQPLAVVIQTGVHRIEGVVHIRPQERLKDELDRPERFLAVTDAVIYDLAGQEVGRSAFLAVRREAIHWVLEQEEEA